MRLDTALLMMLRSHYIVVGFSDFFYCCRRGREKRIFFEKKWKVRKRVKINTLSPCTLFSSHKQRRSLSSQTEVVKRCSPFTTMFLLIKRQYDSKLRENSHNQCSALRESWINHSKICNHTFSFLIPLGNDENIFCINYTLHIYLPQNQN